MRAFRFLPMLIVAACAPASAADRGYTVTDFDRIRAEGPFDVVVRVGPAASVRARGTPAALDRLDVEVRGDTLVIQPDHAGWGGWPGGGGAAGKVTLAVTVPMLRGIALTGSGGMTVDRLKAAELQLAISGSGDLAVAQLQAEKLGVAIAGSGSMTLAGRAMQADASVQGSGDLAATALSVGDATLSLQGSGDLAITATRTAKVASAGSGDVTVAGPAACAVAQAGSGEVRCGREVE